MARQRVNGDGTFPQQESEQMAREPSHGETVSGQRIVREYSHGETRSVQRIVRILVLTSDRACSGAANPWTVDPRTDKQRELGPRATECVVCGPAAQ